MFAGPHTDLQINIKIGYFCSDLDVLLGRFLTQNHK